MIRSLVSRSAALVHAARTVPSTATLQHTFNVNGAVRTASVSSQLTTTRSFSGNVEYPKIEGTVLEVSENLNNIGARLSTATAALYLTKPKIEYIVSKTKTIDELKQVQKVLLMCDAKYAFPSEFAASSFISACIRLEAPEIALEYVRNAKHVRHYLRNRSFVRLATYYVMTDLQPAIVDELVQIMQDRGVECSHKMYTFRIMNAKKQNKYEEAVAIAKEAAVTQQINSYLIIQLLKGFEGKLLEEQKPLAHYLVSKGNVYANEKLKTLLSIE